MHAIVHVQRSKDSCGVSSHLLTRGSLGLSRAWLRSLLASHLIYSILFFETRSLTKPGAHQFGKTGRPRASGIRLLLPPQC